MERSSSEVGAPAYHVNELDSSAVPTRVSLEGNGAVLPPDPRLESNALFDRVLQSDASRDMHRVNVAHADPC